MTISASDFFVAKPVVTKFEIDGMDGKTVYAKMLTGVDRKAIKSLVGKAVEDGITPVYANIIYGVTDESGNRIFKDGDLKRMDKIPETWISVMFAAVMQANTVNEKQIAKN